MRTTARLSQMSGGTASGVISSSSSPSTHTAQCPNPRTLWLTAARQLQLVEPKPEITAWTLAATASRRATFVILSWVWMNAATAQPLAATFDVLLLTRPNEMGRRVKLESVASGKLASPATLIHVGKPNHSHAEGDGDQDVVDFTFFPAAAAPASFSLREATGWTLTERSGTPWMSAYPIPQGRLDPKPCILKVQEVTLPNARLTFMATMAGRLECVALENGKPGFSGGGGAGKILCRHAIKLMAPISALHILDVTASPELECWQVRLLVSSTLGPPVVWFAIFSSNSANQHHSIVWTLYVMLLLRPESDDAPLCTSIVDMPDKLVAVGTYAGKVKFYSTQEVTADATVPPVAGLELTCQSPVRSLHFEPKSSEKLRILSTDGLHTFELVK